MPVGRSIHGMPWVEHEGQPLPLHVVDPKSERAPQAATRAHQMRSASPLSIPPALCSTALSAAAAMSRASDERDRLGAFGLREASFTKEIADVDLWLPTSKVGVVEEFCEAVSAHASVLLPGDPGVGKTCVLRALRKRLPEKRVHPVFLIDEAHLLHAEMLRHLHILLNYEWDSKALQSSDVADHLSERPGETSPVRIAWQ